MLEDEESLGGQHANRAGSGVGLTYAYHRGTSRDRAKTGTRDATRVESELIDGLAGLVFGATACHPYSMKLSSP